VLIPEFRRAGVDLNVLVSNGSATAAHYANKLGFRAHSTDSRSIFDDESISTVVVATRHDSHARYVINAIESGKHVFVEKPLCLTSGQLDGIREALSINPVVLTVGFNRRFSPLVLKMRQLLMKTTGPKTLVMTVNAGQLPADHWTRDPAVGGGRVVGEACHFVDLLRHLADCPITDFWLSGGIRAASSGPASDNVIFNLQFEDGSIGSVQYIATGHKSYPKERLEVFAGGKVLQLDNFRRLTGWGWKGFSSKRLLRQDKGQQGCVAAFVEAVEGSSNPPIAYAELFEVSLVSIELADMAH
jgi:predicted dehydrogenase